MTNPRNSANGEQGFSSLLPYSAHFLLNDNCNARCVFCGGDYFRSRSGKAITLEKFKVMARNIHLEHFRTACLAGAGDPLLNRDFVPIMEYLHATYPTVAISVTTNGIGLNRALSEAILACGVTLLNISLNAATRETYQRLMRVDAFDRICQQVRDFSALCRERGRGPQLQLSIPIMRCNVEELPLLIKFAHEVGALAVNVFYCRFYPREIRNDKDDGFLPDKESLFFHQELSDRIVGESEQLAEQLGVRLFHEPLFSQGYVPKSCHWTENELMIGFDGEVFPCGGGELHFKKKLQRGEYNFGNALQQSIEEFWNNDSYRAVRVSSKKDGPCLIPECLECANMTSHVEQRGHILEWADFANNIETNTRNAASNPSPPLVSVIVPTHNRPDMLKDTIQSILVQTYQEFEIIVVNDAGEDVRAVVESFASPKITYLSHETNKGLAAARNTGIREAKGMYIAYLDDDDIFYPDHLETLVSFLEKSDYKVAYSDANRAYQEKGDDGYIITKRDLPYSYDFDYDRILFENFIPVLSFIHEKGCIDTAGYFDESFSTHEDWDLWVRMSRKFEFAHVKKVTSEFRFRSDGSSMTSSKLADFLRTKGMIYGKYREYAQDKPHIRIYQEISLNTLKQHIRSLDTPSLQNIDIRVSIIMPVFNKLEYTRQCLETLKANTGHAVPFEIIVINNGSNDGTAEYLESIAGDVRSINNRTNLGFAGGCNQGAEAAAGNFLLFLNNDTLPQHGWLEALVSSAVQEKADICGAKLLYPDATVQHAGVAFNDEGMPYHIFKGFPTDAPAVNRKRHMQCVTAACMLIKKGLFLELGGFDEGYRNGFEDIDLCLQARTLGKNILYNPESILIHFEETTPGRKDHDRENRERFLARWQGKVTCDDTDIYRAEGYKKEITPNGVFIEKIAQDLQEDSGRAATSYLVTAIVSTYNSADFIRECLEDLENQTIADRLEIIVIDAASPQNEGEIVAEFRRKYDNITYIRTDTRIGVYAAWNMAIREARGAYITPFSTNDRLRDSACEILARALCEHPEAMLVYGDTYLTRVPHETFENNSWYAAFQWPDYSYEQHLETCLVGPHPMWRREVHDEIGYFDEKYVACGDQEFWLRMGERFKLLHIPEFTGLYWITPEGLSNRTDITQPELHEIRTRYRQRYASKSQEETMAYSDTAASNVNISIDSGNGATNGGNVQPVNGIQLSINITVPFEHLEKVGAFFQKLFSTDVLGVAGPSTVGALSETPVKPVAAVSEEIPPPEELYAKALSLANSGRQDEAIAELEGVLRLHPHYALAHNDLGVLYYQKGDKVKSLGHHEKAVQLNPENITFRKNLAELCFVELGRTDDAIFAFLDILKKHPNDVETLMDLGRISVAIGRPEEAKTFFGKALNIEPWNAMARQQLDLLRDNSGSDLNGVIASLNNSVTGHEQNSPEEAYRVVETLVNSGREDEAIIGLERLLQRHPHYALAYNDLGVLYHQRGDTAKSLEHHEKAVRLNPENVTFRKNLAELYFTELGRTDDAIFTFLDILKKHPNDAGTLTSLGHISSAVGQPEEAKTFFKKALDIEPWNVAVRQQLDQLAQQVFF